MRKAKSPGKTLRENKGGGRRDTASRRGVNYSFSDRGEAELKKRKPEGNNYPKKKSEQRERKKRVESGSWGGLLR